MPSTRLDRIKQYVDRRPYTPLLVFVVAPISLFIVYCVGNDLVSSFAALLGMAVFVAYGLFVWYLRRGESGSLGASIPTVCGPFLAQFYVENAADELFKKSLHEYGGNTLVQLAFLFAGIVNIWIYLLQRGVELRKLREANAEHVKEQTKKIAATGEGMIITCLALIVLFGAFAFYTRTFAPYHPPVGPTLFWVVSAPACTPLTVCRVVLVIWSMGLASVPPSSGLASTEPLTNHAKMVT